MEGEQQGRAPDHPASRQKSVQGERSQVSATQGRRISSRDRRWRASNTLARKVALAADQADTGRPDTGRARSNRITATGSAPSSRNNASRRRGRQHRSRRHSGRYRPSQSVIRGLGAGERCASPTTSVHPTTGMTGASAEPQQLGTGGARSRPAYSWEGASDGDRGANGRHNRHHHHRTRLARRSATGGHRRVRARSRGREGTS